MTIKLLRKRRLCADKCLTQSAISFDKMQSFLDCMTQDQPISELILCRVFLFPHLISPVSPVSSTREPGNMAQSQLGMDSPAALGLQTLKANKGNCYTPNTHERGSTKIRGSFKYIRAPRQVSGPINHPPGDFDCY